MTETEQTTWSQIAVVGLNLAASVVLALVLLGVSRCSQPAYVTTPGPVEQGDRP